MSLVCFRGNLDEVPRSTRLLIGASARERGPRSAAVPLAVTSPEKR